METKLSKIGIAQGARYRVASGAETCLCYAVAQVCGVGPRCIAAESEDAVIAVTCRLQPAAEDVFRRIKRHLKGAYTFTRLHEAEGLDRSQATLRAARVAFMDALIKEWEAEC